MDKSTHEVRNLNWTSIIEQCQNRPAGQSAKQWLASNGISEKQYYYWLRKIRKQTYEQNLTVGSPTVGSKNLPAVAFAEIPSEGIISSDPVTVLTIKTRKLTLEISSAISEASMIKLIKAVADAV